MDQRMVDYVSSLPAVAAATNNRITYTRRFKHRVASGYRHGESPVAMFREAGLGPETIGYKRIERCVANWRSLYPEPDEEGTLAREPDCHGNMRMAASMGVVLAQEQRINALERRLSHMTEVLRQLGVEA
ncbi:hypothetical protein [Bifidobacterium longum]|uniref:hypothetical protein n=1 Tax=Bifidobacterium longum TaxID=216816 RepID=UPI003C6D1B88